jgi:RNA polymerase sigma-70 factor (ECF subfamily)
MSDDLSEALTAAQAGDDLAFARLWRAYQPPLLRYLRVVVGRTDADDVASAAWLDVARSLHRFSGDLDGFRGWLFTIGRRRAVDALRAAGRRSPTSTLDAAAERPDPAGDAADVAAGRWSTTAALGLIATLKPEQAEIVALRVIADLDVTTVAKIVGKRPGAVRVATHRALRELATRTATDLPLAADDR